MTSDSIAADPLLPGLRAPGNRVSRRAISYWTARAAVSGAVVVLAEVTLAATSGFPAAWRAAIIAATVLVGVDAIVMARLPGKLHPLGGDRPAPFTQAGWGFLDLPHSPRKPVP